ncbi:MAG TPA: tripartite tricarboxylate transporter substrate binding protein [Eoetvoesiella sp.]
MISRHVKWLGLALLIPTLALAQAYPQKNVTIVVSAAPGGPTDTLVRPLAAQLRERFNQTFIVENRAGAGGNIATDQVARAPADGYTLLATNDASIVVNPQIYDKLPYDALKDLQPIAMLGDNGDIVLAVTQDSPAKNVQELVEQLRRDPKANYVSSGVGFPSHIVSELFKREAKFDAVHIPSKGSSNGLLQLLSGDINFYFMPASMAAAQIKGGKIRLLAVAANKRNYLLPDVPTMAESGYPGVSPAPYWITIFAPSGTPKAVIDSLSKEIRHITDTPSYQQVLRLQGLLPSTLNPEDLSQRMSNDFNYWKGTVKALGIHVD